MNVSYQVETFEDWQRDSRYLWRAHFDELALHKELVEPALDEAKYRAAEPLGQIHIVTARVDGEIIGYYIAAVLTHLHYKNAGLMAYTDMYFVSPQYRIGGIGAKLLMFAEQTLKRRGVVKMYLSTKVHQDNSELILALGYEPSDKVFTKVLR